MVSPVSGSAQAQSLHAVVFKQPAGSVAGEPKEIPAEKQPLDHAVQLKNKDVYGPPAPTQTGKADQEWQFVEDPRFDPNARTPKEKIDTLRENLREGLGDRGAKIVEGAAGAGAVIGNKRFNLSTGLDGIAPGAKLKLSASAKRIKVDDAVRLNVPLNDRPREYKAMVTFSVPLGGKPRD